MTRRSLLWMLGGALARPHLAATTPEETALRGKDKLIVHSPRPLDLETPPALLDSWITPLNRFFVRTHFYIPQVEAGRWQLSVEGLVGKPYTLTLEQLGRMPQVEQVVTIECAGNGRAYFEPHVAGIQWRKGSVGTARWKGVRLRDVLGRAAVKPEARQFAFDGADTGMGAVPDFVRSIPLEKALAPETMLATHMNGVPIPVEHGFPLRLITPGWEGAACTKWVTKITALPAEAEGFFMQTAYRYPTRPLKPGEAVDPKDLEAIRSLGVKTLITHSADPIAGVAWAGENQVARVEVSTDGGQTWHDARLGSEKAPFAWRRFSYDWRAGTGGGATTIAARATDSRGRTQPDVEAWNPSGYLYNVPDRVQAGKLEAYPELARALPPGAGQKIAEAKCMACHDQTMIVGQRLDPVRWTREVEKMMRWGAPVTEQEKDVLARYLAEHFR